MKSRRGLCSGFPPALNGLKHLLLTERHAKFHLLATILVIIAGLAANLSTNEWLWILLSVTLVWMAELFNTAVERLGDRVTGEPDPLIGQAKDLAAAAVLMAAGFAIVVGLVVFL